MNKTYIDWIHKWPLDALNAVAEKVLINVGYITILKSLLISNCKIINTNSVGYIREDGKGLS